MIACRPHLPLLPLCLLSFLLGPGCTSSENGAALAPNLLVGGVFEQAGDDGVPQGWRVADKATRATVDRTEPPEGLPSSVRIAVEKGESKLHSQFLQNVEAADKNTLYVLSGWMKADLPPQAAYLQVKLFGKQGERSQELTRMTAAKPSDQWRRFQYVFDSAEADTVFVLARIDVTPQTVGKSLYLAGMSLRKATLDRIDVGRTPALMDALVDRLPEPDRQGRYTVTTVDGRTTLAVRNFGESAKLLIGQPLKVKPGKVYRVTYRTRGWGQLDIQLHDKKGVAKPRGEGWQPTTLSLMTRPDDRWHDYRLLVGPVKTDTLWLNVFVRYATVWGTCELQGLTVRQVDAPVADRPVEVRPDWPTVARKLLLTEAKALRAFTGAPLDGTVRSRHYSYSLTEYGDRYWGQPVFYNYNAFDGLHVVMPRDTAFNYVSMRGGAATRMVRGAEHFDRDDGSTVLWEFLQRPMPFKGHPRETRRVEVQPQSAWFDLPVAADKVSFFDTAGGTIADVGFYRVGLDPIPSAGPAAWALTARTLSPEKPKDVYDVRNISLALEQRRADGEDRLLRMTADAKPEPVALKAGVRTRFFSEPVALQRGLGSLTLEFDLAGATDPITLTTLVHDVLDPRRDLHCVSWRLPRAGRYVLNLDFPDQVVFAGRPVWITLHADTDCTVAGTVAPQWMTPEAATPEALAWRKFIMACQYLRISEPRSWMRYKEGWSRQKVYEHYGPGLGRHLAELFATIDECHALAPDDDTVRQYRQWCMIGGLTQRTDPTAPPAPPEGVPAWAHYSRMGWLEMRKIAERWIDRRIVKTGEFGGRCNDDSCLYQQMTDFPHLQDDGIVPTMKDAARRFRALTLRKTVVHGINYNDMDSLHAYEEGMNHLALMARWHYGDPLYVESLMESARSVEKFTIVTEDGRRHFRDDKQGLPDITKPRPITTDSGRRSLTMHPTLQLIDYNRNPAALAFASQWADTWTACQKPGNYATVVDVKTGKVVAADKDNPFRGYSQAESHIWLSDMTGDPRFVKPLVDAYRTGTSPSRVVKLLPTMHNLGALDDLPKDALDKLAEQSPVFKGYLQGDPQAVADPILGTPEGSWGRFLSTIYHVRRWPDMMNPGKQYTDRVWFAMMENVARVYLGGHSKRNSTYPGQAVHWQGFSDRYAAVVLVNRRDRMRALVYNFSEQPMTGTMRVWRLRHGDYEVTVGPDRDGDHTMDHAATTRTMTLRKADSVPVSLPPRQVTVIEVKLLKARPSIFTRPDLAVVGRETSLAGRTVTGVLHNIGSSVARDVQIVCKDKASGRVLGMTAVKAIDAPLDLMPRRVEFRIELNARPTGPMQVVVDPLDQIEEIYEGNNTAELE